MSKVRALLRLFVEFLKFGCFTFGGGWSIVAQMQKLYVEDRKDITSQELLDMTSVGRSLPGTMIGNIAMLFGYHMQGIPGGIVCVLGMILPPMAILCLITYFYTVFQSNPWVMAGMAGVRAAVVPIMIGAVIGMIKGAYKYPPCIAVTLLTAGLYLFFDVSCVWLVVIGAVCGFIISEYYERFAPSKKGGPKA